MERIRRLADDYHFVVVVDGTIGTSTNVDVMGVAGIIVTSLTKSFSGFADFMAGMYELLQFKGKTQHPGLANCSMSTVLFPTQRQSSMPP